jgi:hypothetical protein
MDLRLSQAGHSTLRPLCTYTRSEAITRRMSEPIREFIVVFVYRLYYFLLRCFRLALIVIRFVGLFANLIQVGA